MTGTIRPSSRVLAGFLAALLAGCTLGPDYERPALPVPDDWREIEPSEQASLANTPWWELIGDPELIRLIDIALAENHDLAIAAERIEEARALYGFTRAERLPTVDAYGSAGVARATRNGAPPLPSGIDVEEPFYAFGGTVRWELDLFGRIRRATEAQLALLYAAEENRRAVVVALVADVARAYTELRDLDRRLAISERTLASRQEYVELAKVRFEGGRTSEIDWRQAEAELHRTQAIVHEIQALVAQKENEISFLIGRGPGEIARTGDLPALPVPAELPLGRPAELIDRRPDLRAVEQLLVSENARIGEARALLFPNLTLNGFYGWESTEIDDLLESSSVAYSASADLLQPIFDGGRRRRNVEVAESRQRQALYEYERSVLSAFREVEDALVGFRRSGQRRTAQISRVAAERQVLSLAEIRYRGGVAEYLEVLDAQRSLFDAEFSESDAIRDELLFLIELYRSLGGGAVERPAPETTAESAAAGAASL